MVRNAWEFYGNIFFNYNGKGYKVKGKRTVAKYSRQGRELPLYACNGVVSPANEEEMKEARYKGQGVYFHVDECDIPVEKTEEVAVAV